MSEPLADVLAALDAEQKAQRSDHAANQIMEQMQEHMLEASDQIIAALRLADAVATFDESDSDEDGEELDNALTSYRRKRDAAK